MADGDGTFFFGDEIPSTKDLFKMFDMDGDGCWDEDDSTHFN